MSWIFYDPNAVEPPDEEEGEPDMVCPICGADLYDGDTIYKADGDIVGCEHCIEQSFV